MVRLAVGAGHEFQIKKRDEETFGGVEGVFGGGMNGDGGILKASSNSGLFLFENRDLGLRPISKIGVRKSVLRLDTSFARYTIFEICGSSCIVYRVSGKICCRKFLRPQHESNMRTWLRRPLLYPLSYGGSTSLRIITESRKAISILRPTLARRSSATRSEGGSYGGYKSLATNGGATTTSDSFINSIG